MAEGTDGLVRHGRDGWEIEAAMRKVFTGVGTALITPFTKTGAVDEEPSLPRAGRVFAGAGHA